MPVKVSDWVAGAMGATIFRRNKKRFRIAKTNLSTCFPDKSEREIVDMVYGLFRAQARAIIEYPILWWRARAFLCERIEVIGFDHVQAARDRGWNTIILLCHSASIDVAVSALSIHTISSGPYNRVRNRLLDWLIARGRTRFGTTIYTREEGLRPLIKSTRSGRVLIYAGDEDLGSKSKCVFAPFFGVQKATVPVLGRMGKATHAKILTCISYYDFDRSRYVVRISPPLQGIDGEDDQADAQVMNASVEEAVRHCPEQYLWTLRLFQTRPANEGSVY